MGAIVVTNGNSSSPSAYMAAAALAGNLGFGGTLGKGFVLGGRLDFGGGCSRTTLRTAGKSYLLKGNLEWMSAQLFADWYIVPTKGVHVETGVGPGMFDYNPTPDNDSGTTTKNDTQWVGGAAGIIGVGFEGWIAEAKLLKYRLLHDCCMTVA